MYSAAETVTKYPSLISILHRQIDFLVTISNAVVFFFFNDTATTEIYTLSLHDALPICPPIWCHWWKWCWASAAIRPDRKSTRLNSSHQIISYAVFCLKKKNRNKPRGLVA